MLCAQSNGQDFFFVIFLPVLPWHHTIDLSSRTFKPLQDREGNIVPVGPFLRIRKELHGSIVHLSWIQYTATCLLYDSDFFQGAEQFRSLCITFLPEESFPTFRGNFCFLQIGIMYGSDSLRQWARANQEESWTLMFAIFSLSSLWVSINYLFDSLLLMKLPKSLALQNIYRPSPKIPSTFRKQQSEIFAATVSLHPS